MVYDNYTWPKAFNYMIRRAHFHVLAKLVKNHQMAIRRASGFLDLAMDRCVLCGRISMPPLPFISVKAIVKKIVRRTHRNNV